MIEYFVQSQISHFLTIKEKRNHRGISKVLKVSYYYERPKGEKQV